MILQIIHLLFLSALFLVPMCLYKRRNRFMTRFCFRMTALAAARRLYRLVLLIVLLLYHYITMSVQPCELGILGSTLLFAMFFGFANVDRWLHRLNKERKTFAVAALSAVAFAFTPHLFTLAVSVALILLAAMFYPSQRILAHWANKERRMLFADFEEMIAKLYY